MTAIWETEDYQQFLARIREQPADDVVRLVFADWLEERGHGERAEFVRVSIAATRHPGERLNPDATYGEYWTLKNRAAVLLADYGEKWFTAGTDFYPSLRAIVKPNDPHVVVSRGFVSSVSGPLASLHGGECGAACPETGNRCDGGRTIAPNPAFTRECKACHGTGRTPGILAELIRREPIGCDGIGVTDCDPLDNAGVGTYFGERAGPADQWFLLRQTGSTRVAWELPADVFDALDDDSFASADAARLALSRALYSIHAPQSEVSR